MAKPPKLQLWLIALYLMAAPLQAQEEMEPGIVKYTLPFNGGEVRVTFNSLDGEVLRQLLIMSYLVREDEPYQEIDIPLISGRHLKMKLNVDDPESRLQLKKIAESYEEIFYNKFVISRMDYLGGSVLAVLNTAKQDVIEGLKKLNDEVDETSYFIEETFGLFDGTDMKVKLNLNEQHVRNALKKLAVKFTDTPAVVEPNPVTVNLPYKSGIAVGIFDINNLEVINTLRKLSHDVDETQPFIVQTFELWNGKQLWAKLNMDNKNVRKVLQSIAEEYHELRRKAEANFYTMTFSDGKIKGTFDLNKEKVIDTLTKLDKNVDINEPYEIKRIPLEDGAVIYVRLNTNSAETIIKLKEIANDYEEELEHIPNVYEVIDLPYVSNVVRVVLNVGNDLVLKRLKHLSDNVNDSLYLVKNIHLYNGTILRIQLGINDLLTLATLRRISHEYVIISNNTDYRYVSKTLPFSKGNAIAVFDVSNLDVIEKLHDLDSRIVSTSHQATEFRLFDGSVLSVHLNFDDPVTRDALRDIAVQYEECTAPEVPKYFSLSLTWPSGDAVAVFDLKNPKVVEGLHKISNSYADDPSTGVYKFPLSDESIFLMKFNLEDPETRAALRNLSLEYKEYVKPYVPNFTMLSLEWEKGRAIGVYDTNKPSVMQGLRDLNDPNGTDVEFVLSNTVTVPLKLNVSNWKTREVLRFLADQYEEYVQPYLPHLVTQVLPLKNKLAVGVFDTNNPKVVISLQGLDNAEDIGRVYNFPLSNGSSFLVTLDGNDAYTVAKLRDIAEKFDEFSYSNCVTVKLPFAGGLILATFDMNKPEVVAGLKSLTDPTEADVHLIPLNNDDEMFRLNLNLKNPENRKALQDLAEKYQEYIYPKSTLITKSFPWNNGRAVAVFDTSKPEVIKGLTSLRDETGKDEVFPVSDGDDLVIPLNLNDPEVRETLRHLSETYAEYVKPTLVPLTLKFEGVLANAVFDISKPEVVSRLRDISRTATGEPVVKTDFSTNGELLELKYNPGNSTVRELLHDLAEQYEEIQEPNYLGVSLDFNRGKAVLILDLNKPEVLGTLEKLSADVNLDEPTVTVNISTPASHVKILSLKLNIERREVREAIQGIAEHYREILYDQPKSNLVSFELPFDKGFVDFTVDSFNDDVVEELRRMTDEAGEDSPGAEILLVSENFMTFKININDSPTRQRLEGIAEKYKETIIDQPPDYVIKILPYDSGELVAVLDVNQKEVVETLQMLDDMVDEDQPYIEEQILLSNGSVLDFKLNIDNSGVRDILCDVAYDCADIPQDKGPKYVSHNMPFDGGIAMAVFDVNKIEVIEELLHLQDDVADGQPNITRDFPLEDGSVLQVKLDINDLETRRALQKIAEKYEEVPEPRRSRTVILDLPFKLGMIVSTFDLSNDDVIEKLKALTSPYSQDTLSVDIPLANGTLLNLNFDVNDPHIRNDMKKLAIEYQEIFDPLQPRLIVFRTPFSEGEIIFVIDADREPVLKKMQELGEHIGDQDSYVVLWIPLDNGTLNFKIDPNDPGTREVLAQISVEYNEFLNTTDPHLSQHHLRYDTGRIFVTFDTSKPNVIERLQHLNSQVRKTEPYVTLKIVLTDGSIEPIKLNIDDPLVRSELKAISSNYEQISHTALLHHSTHSHYQLPFSEGNVLMTLHSEDPTVLEVLGELDQEASKRDSPLTIRIPLPDGSLKKFKLDLENDKTRQALRDVAEKYEEVAEVKPPSDVVNYNFPLDENKKLKVALDLAKKEVFRTLFELDDVEGEAMDLYSEAESGTNIKLDVKNPYTQRELKRVADRYEVLNDGVNKPSGEAANLTYQLPFKDGHVIFVLNPHDPEVISELIGLNNKVNTTQRRVTLRLPLDNDKTINIRLNIDNPEVRAVLKGLAVAYSEVTDEDEDKIVPFEVPFSEGRIDFVLDISDSDVIAALLSLSDQVGDTDKHTLIEIPTVDGLKAKVKLNLDDPTTRSVLQNVALEFKITWDAPKQNFLVPALNLLQYQMPFDGGKLIFTIDPTDETIIEGLRQLSQKVDVKKSRISTKIALPDGSFLNVRLNPDDPETRAELKDIVTDYREIFNSEESEGARTPDDVEKSEPFNLDQVIVEEPSIAKRQKPPPSEEELNQGDLDPEVLPILNEEESNDIESSQQDETPEEDLNDNESSQQDAMPEEDSSDNESSEDETPEENSSDNESSQEDEMLEEDSNENQPSQEDETLEKVLNENESSQQDAMPEEDSNDTESNQEDETQEEDSKNTPPGLDFGINPNIHSAGDSLELTTEGRQNTPLLGYGSEPTAEGNPSDDGLGLPSAEDNPSDDGLGLPGAEGNANTPLLSGRLDLNVESNLMSRSLSLTAKIDKK